MSALNLVLWKAYLAKLAHMSTVQKNDFLPGERDGAEREVKLTVRARNESQSVSSLMRQEYTPTITTQFYLKLNR